MDSSRRRFMQQSLAAAAMPTPALAPDKPHLVLLGDSIFDNGAYTCGQPDVIAQLRRIAPPGWQASLLARDGATVEDIAAQLARLPRGATHLLLSVGGNNALRRQGLLGAPAASVGEAIEILSAEVGQFESAYRGMIGACLARGLPLAICTIYNGNFGDTRFARQARGAVALFNDTIIRTAVDKQLTAIELRLVCTRPEDYANPIEPSSIGAAKIARALASIVAGPGQGQGAWLIGATRS
jgi:hypothetical protein